jgi:hypothetical protein
VDKLTDAGIPAFDLIYLLPGWNLPRLLPKIL